MEGGASLERSDSCPVLGKSFEDPGTVAEPIGVGSRLVEAGKAVRTLNAAAWKKLDLTPYLLGTALEGVRFPLDRRPRRTFEKNYVKAEKAAEVDAKWEEWKAKGVTEEGPVDLVMAMGTVPKPNNKVRVVHNCTPINSCTPDMPYSMDGIAEVAKFLGLGDWLCKIDLRDGYEHVPIHRNWRKFFGVSWKGEVRRFAKLGFGFKLSPVLFQALMDAVASKCNEVVGERVVFVYLDDFLIRGSSLEECRKNLGVLRGWLEDLGLEVNELKSVFEPQQELEYLGKVWNTRIGKVLNSEKRVSEIESECRRLLTAGQATLKEMEVFLGKLEWVARTLQLARCWKRTLLMEVRFWRDRVRMEGLGVRGSGYSGQFSAGSRRELKWWRDNVRHWMPANLDDVWKTRIKEFHTDASGYAYGSSDGLWGLWKIEELNWNIAIKEMEALRRAISRLTRGDKARIGVDNQAVFWCLKRGRSFSWELNDLLRRIGGDMNARKLELDFYWVPSEENLADAASRSWTRPDAPAQRSSGHFLCCSGNSGNFVEIPGRFRRNSVENSGVPGAAEAEKRSFGESETDWK